MVKEGLFVNYFIFDDKITSKDNLKYFRLSFLGPARGTLVLRIAALGRRGVLGKMSRNNFLGFFNTLFACFDLLWKLKVQFDP